MSNLIQFKQQAARGRGVQIINGIFYVFENMFSDLDHEACRLIDAPIMDTTAPIIDILHTELSSLVPESVPDV